MSGYEVSPSVLRQSAQAIQPLAEEFGGMGQDMHLSAESAAAANPGYLTSGAANAMALEATRAISAMADAMTEHAGGLGNSASTYLSTENRVKWMMTRLDRGIPAGATFA